MQKHRKMGVDYGDKRIGIALTDSLCIISSPFEVYKNIGEEDALKHLNSIIKEYDVDEVAMGLPINMDGTEGERALLHRQFGEKLERLSNVKVHFIDERLTSAEAEEILISSGVKSERNSLIKSQHKLFCRLTLIVYKRGLIWKIKK